MRPVTSHPATRTNQFADLPLPRLLQLRGRYLELLTTDPALWAYATAAVGEIDARIAATAARTGVAA